MRLSRRGRHGAALLVLAHPLRAPTKVTKAAAASFPRLSRLGKNYDEAPLGRAARSGERIHADYRYDHEHESSHTNGAFKHEAPPDLRLESLNATTVPENR